MPELTIDIEFEVFCGNCGSGLCSNTRTSRNRGMDQIVVDLCDKCINEKNELINELENKIKNLEYEIDNLQ
jgi:hypothetical protein